MLGIFVDLSKVFDTDHQIVLKKLKLYGITGNNYSWFENYPNNSKQCVIINRNDVISEYYMWHNQIVYF